MRKGLIQSFLNASHYMNPQMMSRNILSSRCFLLEHDKIHLPSGLPKIPPVRIEQIGAAGGTITGQDDVFALHPFAEKLVEVGQGQIQVPSSGTVGRVEKSF